MGVKITGVNALLKNLEITGKEYSAQARDALEEGAFQIAETAQDMSPRLEGNLEASIKVEYDAQGANRRKRFFVYVDEDAYGTGVDASGYRKYVGDYARFIHDGSYEPGKESKAKEARVGVKVGPRFMTRSLRKWSGQIKRDVAEKLRAVSRKAGRRGRRK